MVLSRQEEADAKRKEAESLEQLSRDITDALWISRKYDSDVIKHYVAQDIQAGYDFFLYPRATSRDEHIATIKRANEVDPGYEISIIDAASEVPVDARRATVWLTIAVSGKRHQGSVVMSWETVLRYQWRKRKHGWRCIRHQGWAGAGVPDGVRQVSDLGAGRQTQEGNNVPISMRNGDASPLGPQVTSQSRQLSAAKRKFEQAQQNLQHQVESLPSQVPHWISQPQTTTARSGVPDG